MKRTLIFLLCALLIQTCACAEFSPQLDRIASDYREGACVRAEIRVSIDAIGNSDSIAEILNSWLAGSSIRLASFRPDADLAVSEAELIFRDASALKVSRLENAGAAVTVLNQSGNGIPDSENGKTALWSNGSIPVPAPDAAEKILSVYLPALYDIIAENASVRETKTSTSIRNAGTSPRYTDYVLSAEAINSHWPQVVSLLEESFADCFFGGGSLLSEWTEILGKTVFVSECRFKRMFDSENRDMGIQFTGNGGTDGSGTRKITLYGGYKADKGMYLSFSAPAVRGENNVKTVFGCALTGNARQRTLEISGSWQKKTKEQSESGQISGTFRNKLEERERITGKAELTRKKNGITEKWTVRPDIEGNETGLEGTVGVEKMTGQDKTAFTVSCSLMRSETAPDQPEYTAADESESEAETQNAVMTLYRMLLASLAELTEDEREAVSHFLRTDAWLSDARAETVFAPVQTEENMEEWSVIEVEK